MPCVSETVHSNIISSSFEAASPREYSGFHTHLPGTHETATLAHSGEPVDSHRRPHRPFDADTIGRRQTGRCMETATEHPISPLMGQTPRPQKTNAMRRMGHQSNFTPSIALRRESYPEANVAVGRKSCCEDDSNRECADEYPRSRHRRHPSRIETRSAPQG